MGAALMDRTQQTAALPGARALAPQLDALTGLRGLAAWYVVLFHTRVTLKATVGPMAYAFLSHGYLAVDLFFILSGFVLWHSGADNPAYRGARGMARFWLRRIARIWPLHMVLLGGFVALVGLLAATGRDTSFYRWGELPLHVLLMQNWGMTIGLMWNEPAWSISCEWAAYLLFPFTVMAAPWRDWSTGALVALGCGLLAGLWAYFALHGSADYLGYEIQRTGLMRCLLEFWTGNVLRMLWARWRDVPDICTGAWAAMIALLEGGVVLHLPEASYIPGVFAALILALSLEDRTPARLLRSGPLHWLGEISYSTYLSHFLLFIVFKMLFVGPDLTVGLGKLALFLLLVLAASAALYRLVEQPAQRWLLRRGEARLAA